MDHLPRNFNTETVDKMARVTLNAGFHKDRDPEEEKLIAEFLAKNSVTKCPPAGVPGSETCRATNELVAKQRRTFRKKTK
jgi:hypothetical protein